jgi:excinuclease ABC subunit A
MDTATIKVKGAREHNLKNVSLTLPRGKLICFTGVSGSGKSSFAFDTLFAEGQRRYLESLSSYARQFLGQLAKPDVDQITGLSPAVSIQQKSTGWNPRSTVGTVTQIHDYLRVLFARIGRQHCPKCGQAISAQSREQIIARILELPAGTKALILAPVVRGQKGEYRDLFEDLQRQGYVRARVDGRIVELTAAPPLAKNIRHHIEIVVDRLTVHAGLRARLAEAVENALKLGQGALIIAPTEPRGEGATKPPFQGRLRHEATEGDELNRQSTSVDRQSIIKGDLLLSSHYACPVCDLSFEQPSPQLFSFNSPQGMCTTCDGMGETFDFDPNLLVSDPRKAFLKYAVDPMRLWGRMGRWKRHIYRGVAEHVGFDLNAPWQKLPQKAKDALLFGLGDQHITFEWRWSGGVWRHGGPFEGVLADLREKHRRAQSGFVRDYYEKFMRKAVCPACHGARLNAQAMAVRIGRVNINELSALSIADADRFFDTLQLGATEQTIARDAIREIRARLMFLCDVGLDYLALDRPAPTLSGGESQRIRLASQIGAGLVGVLYVLDEPSIGLHPRDNERLLASLCRLRDMGNTVIVVEHDEQTMRAADHIVDFGPGPGVRGGEVVVEGDIDEVIRSKRSVTGSFLRGDERIEIPAQRRPVVRAADFSRRGRSLRAKSITKAPRAPGE